MNKTKIIIIGGIGTAVNIAEQIQDAIDHFGLKDEFLGFAFDNESMGDYINNYPLLCKSYEVYEKYHKFSDVKFIYQLYRPDKIKERSMLLNTFNIPTERFYNFIHPTSVICRSVTMGFGNVMQAHSVINSNAKLGNHNTLNSACLIGHDTTVGHHNFFAAHSCVGSNVKLGDYNFLGLNATTNNQIEIGSNIMIGMCSNVLKGISSDRVVFGNPAIYIKSM